MQPAAVDSLAAEADSLLPDTLAADSAAADTSQALVDTTGGVGRLGRDLGEAAEAASQGRFDEAFERIADGLLAFAIENLLPAVLLAVLFWVVLRVVVGLLDRALGRASRVDTGVQQLILRFARVVILSIAGIVVLDELGVAVAPFVAGLGIAGIAIGFAAQDTVQNLIAGVTIILDRPFQVGDNIELHDIFGTVEEITLRTTRVRTLDNQMAILPNANVITEKIINHSMLRALRIVVPFGIAYKESPQAAREAVLAITEGDERLHPDFPPAAVVTDLGDSSVNMALRIHLKDPSIEVPVRLEYQEKVFEALRAAGIEIPFPHLQLFIDEAKAFEGTRLLAPPRPRPADDRGEDRRDPS
ncbi:mechanosensitive ion channel family protein [Rubrivirga marina]|uniref:Mechanosensitive ion channel protein MscS n=1 Tax=Rubrivirga marina TaxID=1196024 RepID=A0A271J149_9BACT|nr:mechanosensitive ion channel family protein [Rubrivirga marina]PAP77037.1 hypothetical protein BSZ37_11650 [Rubrivirga marina]